MSLIKTLVDKAIEVAAKASPEKTIANPDLKSIKIQRYRNSKKSAPVDLIYKNSRVTYNEEEKTISKGRKILATKISSLLAAKKWFVEYINNKAKTTDKKPVSKSTSKDTVLSKIRTDFIAKQMTTKGMPIDALLTVKEASFLQKKFPDIKSHLARFRAYVKANG